MKNELPHPSLKELIREGDINDLKEELNELTPFEIAEIISNANDEDKSTLFRALSSKNILDTFDLLSIPIQRRLLNDMPVKEAVVILKEISPDDRTQFLQDLPREVIDELVKHLPYEERSMTLSLLGYPRGSIGRVMTPDYLAVKMDWSIENVLDHIQNYGHDSETINVIYVIDDEGKLLDDINLKEFLFVPRNSKVKSIANGRFVALSVYDNDEIAVKVFNQHDRVALPVVDEKGILLGIVTIDDILRISNQEATEDIQMIGGTEALDEPYLQAPFMELMNKRARWLVILFLGEMFTATAMGFFENEIAKAVVLALFLPLIISSGGNAGSQASTLVIRAMALGEVKLKDWWRVCRREVFSGIFLGTVLGMIGFLRVALWTFFTNIYGPHWIMIAFTVGFSLLGVVLWGTLTGALLPLALRRLGVDPATSSAPCVATIVDVTGVVIYFMIAVQLLHGTLL